MTQELAIRPRGYQSACVDGVFNAFGNGYRSTLAVLPTGGGKTVIFSLAGKRWFDTVPGGKVLVLAHREELVFQAHEKAAAITGEHFEIEMGEYRASERSLLDDGGIRGVVASVQSLCRSTRLRRYQPHEPWLVIVDEAHHCIPRNKQYYDILEYFLQNDLCKVLGVTATPDRADEEALGQAFHSVAYEYEVVDAITDGWLCPIRQQEVLVQDLDLSKVRTDKGDLSATDLDAILREEKMLHKIVDPTIKIANGRPTLVFAPSVGTAHQMAEIFNRHASEQADEARQRAMTAVAIDGETDRELRRHELRRYARGEFGVLIGCGVFTEGFDCPRIEVVAMGRMTKSRSLYSQMSGRGTRTVKNAAGIGVDDFGTAAERRRFIASSPKPFVTLIDFVGNSGRHKLVYAADILGGKESDEVVERAKAKAKARAAEGLDSDTLQDLIDAREEQKVEERRKRRQIIAEAIYHVREVDPFDLLDVTIGREPGYLRGQAATPRQVSFLRRAGVRNVEGLSLHKATKLIEEVKARETAGKCNPRQAAVLAAHGYDANCSFSQAAEFIKEINNANRAIMRGTATAK